MTYTEDYNVFENRLEDYDLILLNSKLNRLTDPQYHGLLMLLKWNAFIGNPWSVCFVQKYKSN